MYPAYQQIGREIGLGHAAWRVYMALQPPVLDFVEPRDVKVLWLVDTLKMGRTQACNAIKTLCERGYLIDCGREGRIRKLRLAYSLAKAA